MRDEIDIPKDTKIEDIKEFFQTEVMTSSPSPNFFSNRRYCFLRPISHNIFYLKKKKGDQRSIFAVNCYEIPENSLIIT